MKLKSQISVFLLAVLAACGPDYDNPDEVISLTPEIKGWLIDDPEMFTFEMLGNDSSQFVVIENGIGHGSSSVAYQDGVFGHYIIERETCDQSFTINGSLNELKIWMQSSNKKHGNLIDIFLMNTRWIYDYSYRELYKVEMNNGYEIVALETGELASTCELMDSIVINAVSCDSVLHFELSDFDKLRVSKTVTEVYYAKHIGLVKFVLNNGVEVERKWE